MVIYNFYIRNIHNEKVSLFSVTKDNNKYYIRDINTYGSSTEVLKSFLSSYVDYQNVSNVNIRKINTRKINNINSKFKKFLKCMGYLGIEVEKEYIRK